MKFADRNKTGQKRFEGIYSESEGDIILGIGLTTQLYQIDLERERLITIDAEIDNLTNSINDIYEEDGEVYAGTGNGVISLESGENVALEGVGAENLDKFNDRFVYFETRGGEVKDQQDNVLWNNSDTQIQALLNFDEDLYIATTEGENRRYKRLYSLDEGLIDEFDRKYKSGKCFMTSHEGNLYGCFGGVTWKLSDQGVLEKVAEASFTKEGVFEYESRLMEWRNDFSGGITELSAENNEIIVPDDNLPTVNTVRTISSESFDNIDGQVVEVDEIEVRGDEV